MKYRQAFLNRKCLSYLCGAAIIFFSTPATLAADAVEVVTQVVGCATVDDKDRLSCFDKAAAPLTTAGVPRGPGTANTKEIVTNFSPNDFKVVDPDDLHVAPGTFIGKPIEIRNVRCLYAGDGYRCLTPRRRGTIAVVFAKSVDPAAERETLENNCSTIERIESPACRRDIRTVPIDYGEDSVNPVAKRIVLRAGKIEIQPTLRPKQ